MQRCHPATKKYQSVTAVKQNNATSTNPAHAALRYIKWLSVKDWWFIQDKGAASIQQSVPQEPLPGSSNCVDGDSSTHSPPEVTSSELGWGTLAGQCGEACIAAALAIPVLWRNRGLNFQGCQSAPSTLQVKEKETNLTMPASSEYILGWRTPIFCWSIWVTFTSSVELHLSAPPASWILWFMSWWCSCLLPI